MLAMRTPVSKIIRPAVGFPLTGSISMTDPTHATASQHICQNNSFRMLSQSDKMSPLQKCKENSMAASNQLVVGVKTKQNAEVPLHMEVSFRCTGNNLLYYIGLFT